jgi:hypothetical protein
MAKLKVNKSNSNRKKSSQQASFPATANGPYSRPITPRPIETQQQSLRLEIKPKSLLAQSNTPLNNSSLSETVACRHKAGQSSPERRFSPRSPDRRRSAVISLAQMQNAQQWY